MEKTKQIYNLIVSTLKDSTIFIAVGDKFSPKELTAIGEIAKLVTDESSYEDYIEAVRLFNKYKTDATKVDLALKGDEDTLDSMEED